MQNPGGEKLVRGHFWYADAYEEKFQKLYSAFMESQAAKEEMYENYQESKKKEAEMEHELNTIQKG